MVLLWFGAVAGRMYVDLAADGPVHGGLAIGRSRPRLAPAAPNLSRPSSQLCWAMGTACVACLGNGAPCSGACGPVAAARRGRSRACSVLLGALQRVRSSGRADGGRGGDLGAPHATDLGGAQRDGRGPHPGGPLAAGPGRLASPRPLFAVTRGGVPGGPAPAGSTGGAERDSVWASPGHRRTPSGPGPWIPRAGLDFGRARGVSRGLTASFPDGFR